MVGARKRVRREQSETSLAEIGISLPRSLISARERGELMLIVHQLHDPGLFFDSGVL